jgi:hypothetical protein
VKPQMLVLLRYLWMLSWAVLSMASLPGAGPDVIQLLVAGVLALVIYVGREKIFLASSRNSQSQARYVRDHRISFALTVLITLAAWSVYLLAVGYLPLRPYWLPALIVSLGLTGSLLLDYLARKRFGRERGEQGHNRSGT